MAAAATGYATLASAAGGYDIGNENPLIQAHAKEMVLPSSIAEPLRGMIAANSNGGGGFDSGSSGGGDTHNWNIQALDSRSFARTLNTSAGRATVRGAAAQHAMG
jgi:hypothetical protein